MQAGQVLVSLAYVTCVTWGAQRCVTQVTYAKQTTQISYFHAFFGHLNDCISFQFHSINTKRWGFVKVDVIPLKNEF